MVEDVEWIIILQYHKQNYYGIFKSMHTLSKKSSNPRRGLVSKTTLDFTFNSRAQIDLIDMQSQNTIDMIN